MEAENENGVRDYEGIKIMDTGKGRGRGRG